MFLKHIHTFQIRSQFSRVSIRKKVNITDLTLLYKMGSVLMLIGCTADSPTCANRLVIHEYVYVFLVVLLRSTEASRTCVFVWTFHLPFWPEIFIINMYRCCTRRRLPAFVWLSLFDSQPAMDEVKAEGEQCVWRRGVGGRKMTD